ncbi:MAG TPA: hypothetical protein VHH34_25910, partial [Pseudonocardiaceae bacterium]|nr:hypothetical protein [Pseudonocardiaceae bacterium]
QYLALLERGERGFHRRGLLDDLAEAIGCSVADLTGRPRQRTDRNIAAALTTVPGISLAISDCTLDDVPDVPARPVEQLIAAAAQANAHLDAARFSLAGRDLGSVLTELHVHVLTGDADTRRVALAALSEACLVAASVARHLGHAELAVTTARRGVEAAQLLGDSTRAGLLTMHQALGLGLIGARHRGTAVLDQALAEITPDPSAADTGPAQAAGMMHLTAAMQHARRNRPRAADEHLGHAAELARRAGEGNALLQHFGPVNVATWGVNVAVELQRGPDVAERVDSDLPHMLGTFGSAVRGGALHFDLARAYAQAEGARDAEAIRHLDAADRLAPQYVRPDPVARDLVLTLDRRAPRRVWELDSLRNRFGIGRVNTL